VISISGCNIFEDTFPRYLELACHGTSKKEIDVQTGESSRQIGSLRTAIEEFQLLREDL